MLPLRNHCSTLVPASLLVALTATGAFAQTYLEIDFVPIGVSGDGQVVLGEDRRWSRTLGDLGNPIVDADLVAISDDGSIVAGDFSRDLVREAFVASDDAGVQVTGYRNLGYLFNEADAMSGNGAYVALDSLSPSNRNFELWAPATNEFFEIDAGIVSGSTPPILNDISNDGVLVGRDVGAEAFRWDRVNGRGYLDVPAGSASEARAISNDGQWIAGQAATEAVRWNAAGERFSLGAPPGPSTWASAISGDGSTIGGGAFGFNGAFIWTEAVGYQNIAVLLNSLGIDYGGPFWVLRQVTGISHDGRTIVGERANAGGGAAGFVLVVPEPGAAVLLGLGLGALGAVGRRGIGLAGQRSTA